MPQPPVRRRTRRLATALAVLAGVVGFAPVQQAAAQTAPPALTVGTAAPAVWGPSVPLDLTVTSPSTADVYIELHVDPNLHITDAAGNPLPVRELNGGTEDVVTVGADDANNNGVPGAPLPTGVVHLRVSAVFPVGDSDIVADIMDGATSAYISGAQGALDIGQAVMTGTFQADATTWFPTLNSIPLTAGATAPRIQNENTQVRFSPAPASTHLRLRFSADALAAGDYTAQRLSALKVKYSPNRKASSPSWVSTQWTLGADGSASIDFPAVNWTTNTTGQVDEGLSFVAPWGMPYGYPTGQLQVIGSDGHLYGADPEPLVISADYRPANLQAAVYGRNAAGQLWQFRGSSYIHSGKVFDGPTLIGGGWNAYDTMTPIAPLKADGTGTMVARDRSGVLWLYRGSGKASAPFLTRTRIGGGWGVYRTLTGVGDVTGDGRADLIARDAGGVLWLYRRTGSTTAPFAPRTRIGGGWAIYNVTTGGSDLTGDGRADLIARDASGALWLYVGTGKATAPFAPRAKVGTGWQGYTHIVSVGDVLADGHADIVATDSKGTAWYYAGTGKASAPYASRKSAATGWTTYTAVF